MIEKLLLTLACLWMSAGIFTITAYGFTEWWYFIHRNDKDPE